MRKVAQYDPDTGEKLNVFDSIEKAAASITGTYSGNICGCCRGRWPTAYGFVWRYYKAPRRKKIPPPCSPPIKPPADTPVSEAPEWEMFLKRRFERLE